MMCQPVQPKNLLIYLFFKRVSLTSSENVEQVNKPDHFASSLCSSSWQCRFIIAVWHANTMLTLVENFETFLPLFRPRLFTVYIFNFLMKPVSLPSLVYDSQNF